MVFSYSGGTIESRTLSNATMEEQDADQGGQFTRIVELLRESGLKAHEAVELAERMSNLASTNTIAQFGSKLESGLEGLRAEMEAQKETLDAKYNILIWMIGGSTVILSIVLTLLTLFGPAAS